MDRLASKLFLNSSFSDTVFVTLLRTAVETAASEVHKLLRPGGVPTSLTLLFWWWMTVSSVFVDCVQTSYSSLRSFTSLISSIVSVDVKYHVSFRTQSSPTPHPHRIHPPPPSLFPPPLPPPSLSVRNSSAVSTMCGKVFCFA